MDDLSELPRRQPSTLSGADPAIDSGSVPYAAMLGDIKAHVRSAQLQAARAVNTELIRLYWRIGRIILDRQDQEGWGTQVINRLSADLASEFPGIRGFSPRNMRYMRTFASAFSSPIGQQAAAQLAWGHVQLLLDRIDDQDSRLWYAEQSAVNGWSRSVLAHHISTGLRERAGAPLNNFAATLAPEEQDATREILRDPYRLDFLALDPGHSERQLEDALVARLTAFLTELGEGFAFLGRQKRLRVGDTDYFLDLLFFHLGLRRYVVFELKVGRVEPEHLGKLSFYVNVVDDLLRKPEHGDGSTIGILLAAERDTVVVEYALRGAGSPMAVSTYTTDRDLPADVRSALPGDEVYVQLVGESRLTVADEREGAPLSSLRTVSEET